MTEIIFCGIPKRASTVRHPEDGSVNGVVRFGKVRSIKHTVHHTTEIVSSR